MLLPVAAGPCVHREALLALQGQPAECLRSECWMRPRAAAAVLASSPCSWLKVQVRLQNMAARSRSELAIKSKLGDAGAAPGGSCQRQGGCILLAQQFVRARAGQAEVARGRRPHKSEKKTILGAPTPTPQESEPTFGSRSDRCRMCVAHVTTSTVV